jgi:hypothetical protein
MIYIPSFMLIDSGIQVILRLLPQIECSLDITDGGTYKNMPLKWPQAA